MALAGRLKNDTWTLPKFHTLRAFCPTFDFIFAFYQCFELHQKAAFKGLPLDIILQSYLKDQGSLALARLIMLHKESRDSDVILLLVLLLADATPCRARQLTYPVTSSGS